MNTYTKTIFKRYDGGGMLIEHTETVVETKDVVNKPLHQCWPNPYYTTSGYSDSLTQTGNEGACLTTAASTT